MSKDKPHVNEIFTRSENKSTPVLLKFQNGDLKNAYKETTLFFPAEHELDKSTKRAVVVTSGNVYSGPVSDGSEDLVDTYICIRNKTTEKVRILPIDHAKLINHVYEDKEKTQFALLTNETARETVMRIFGGRKALRYINNRERNNVNIDSFRDQLEATVENSELNNVDDKAPSSELFIDSIRPPFNEDAKNLVSIYSIRDVIPLELIDRLDEEVGVLMTTDIEDIPIESEYLKRSIVALKRGSKSRQTLLKMKMILYMDGLMTLIKTRVRDLAKLELSKITEKVENDIRDRFSSEIDLRAVRSNTTNEKALCYFLVLAFLISDDYQLDINELSTELCTSKARIAKYGQFVHAKVKPGTNFMILRLPCYAKPNTSMGGKRKRKLK